MFRQFLVYVYSILELFCNRVPRGIFSTMPKVCASFLSAGPCRPLPHRRFFGTLPYPSQKPHSSRQHRRLTISANRSDPPMLEEPTVDEWPIGLLCKTPGQGTGFHNKYSKELSALPISHPTPQRPGSYPVSPGPAPLESRPRTSPPAPHAGSIASKRTR